MKSRAYAAGAGRPAAGLGLGNTRLCGLCNTPPQFGRLPCTAAAAGASTQSCTSTHLGHNPVRCTQGGGLGEQRVRRGNCTARIQGVCPSAEEQVCTRLTIASKFENPRGHQSQLICRAFNHPTCMELILLGGQLGQLRRIAPARMVGTRHGHLVRASTSRSESLQALVRPAGCCAACKSRQLEHPVKKTTARHSLVGIDVLAEQCGGHDAVILGQRPAAAATEHRQ